MTCLIHELNHRSRTDRRVKATTVHVVNFFQMDRLDLWAHLRRYNHSPYKLSHLVLSQGKLHLRQQLLHGALNFLRERLTQSIGLFLFLYSRGPPCHSSQSYSLLFLPRHLPLDHRLWTWRPFSITAAFHQIFSLSMWLWQVLLSLPLQDSLWLCPPLLLPSLFQTTTPSSPVFSTSSPIWYTRNGVETSSLDSLPSLLTCWLSHPCVFCGGGDNSVQHWLNFGAGSEVPPSEAPFKGAWRVWGRGGGDEGLKVEGGFTFGRLQGGFKGAWRGLEGGFKEASRGLQGGFTFGRLQGGLKGASRGLQAGFKGAWSLPKVKGASRGLKGAWRGLQGGLTFGRLQGGLKVASKGLEAFRRWRGLRKGLEEASKGLEGAWKGLPSALKRASRTLARRLYIRGLGMCKACTEAVHSEELWTRVTLGLGMCKACTEAVHSEALWTRVTLGLGMCKACTEAVHSEALWTRVTLGLGMCKACTEAVHSEALWTRVTLGLDMCKACTEAVHSEALWTRVTSGLGMCKVCTEAVHSEELWTRVTLGLGMCKACTEAVHSEALWTRVTSGLGMCKVCTEAIHCMALWTRVT